MKIDVISIFPEYLTPLNLSLLGKAQSAGLVDIRVHNLRDHAIGVHGSVDDTPYGGGAGMVMSPEVWGKALDALIDDNSDLIILTPESHNSEGYLEYPNFTKPAQWRGIDVPEILLSGNHAAIAKWRSEQAQERAKKNR